MNKLRVYLIEHGETALDAQGRVHGPAHAAEPLTPLGRRQAVLLGARLRRMASPPSHIFTSDAARAVGTARIAGALADIPVTTTADLRPLDIGELSGLPDAEAALRLRPYFADPDQIIPGGESVNGWRRRHLGFMQRVARQIGAQGGTPAFLTHANVIGSARAAAANESADAARRAIAHPPTPAVPLALRLPLAP